MTLLKIIKNFLTPNVFSRSQRPLKSVTKIVVHYTGDPGVSAISIRNWFESLKNQNINDPKARSVSSHYVVGLDGEIIQCLPETEMSYCTNQANGYTISIETCYPKSEKSTGKFNDKTLKSLYMLLADLCLRYHLDPNKDIIRHYDVTKKQCPLYYVPTKYQSEELANSRWTEFKMEVNKVLNSMTEYEVATENVTSNSQYDFKVRILDVNLNIRKEAGLQNKIVGVIYDQGIYTINETKIVNGMMWGKLKSGVGWISLGEKYVIKL